MSQPLRAAVATTTEGLLATPRRIRPLLPITVGTSLALFAIHVQFRRSGMADEIGLSGAKTGVATFDGQPISAWRISEYEAIYARGDRPGAHEGLWLGNSQLYSGRGERQIAPAVASATLGFRMYALALPNGNPSEHLVVTTWALSRRHPDILVVPVMFSDLREEQVRTELADLLDDTIRTELAGSAAGASALDFLKAPEAPHKVDWWQNAAVLSEKWLNDRLAAIFPVWARRNDLLAGTVHDLRRLRNRALGISSKTKRHLLPVVVSQHMRSLEALIAVGRRHGAAVLVYVAPVRWDPEPPYVLAEYEGWKREVEALAAKSGAAYLDLDRAIPPAEFLISPVGEPDFKHFNATGHAILAAEVARRASEMLREKS